MDLKKQLRDLWAPVWQEKFPAIDQGRAHRGSALYPVNCAKCHHRVDRTDENRKVVAWMEKLDSVGTDPKTAQNIVNYRGKTGHDYGTDLSEEDKWALIEYLKTAMNPE